MAQDHLASAAQPAAHRPQVAPEPRPNNTASTAPAPGTRGYVGPYSRSIDRGALGSAINGSSREGRYLRAYEAMLWEHVGGAPSIVQRALIVRASRLALHLELMDERALVDGKGLTTHDHNFYIAWSNALGRCLARLGLEPAAPHQVILDEHLARLAQQGAAA